MSFTLIGWAVGLIVLIFASFRRPVYALAVYFYTFFMFPDFWWWGKLAGLTGYRWSYYSGFFALIMLWVHAAKAGRPFLVPQSKTDWLALGILANATLVHLLLAPDWAISSLAYVPLTKFVLLYFLITNAFESRRDFWKIIVILLLCTGYIGYEVTVNDRGSMRQGRLEGIGAPGATGANHLANLMITMLPFVSTCLVHERLGVKLLAATLAPMVLNVILEANSRGAFLGSIGGLVAFLVLCPPRARRYGIAGVLLGCLALALMLRDPRILERFKTTFVGEEERDRSAAERLLLWKAGLAMVSDYPLGAGGMAFKVALGAKYWPDVGLYYERRAVHNGYINEMCEWGVQGFALKMAFLLSAMGCAVWCAWVLSRAGDVRGSLIGAALAAGMVGFLISTLFGDFLDSEWAYWMAGFCTAYVRLFAPTPPEGHSRSDAVGLRG
jgi:hypothetical protein